VRYWVARW